MNFSCWRVCKVGELPHRKFGATSLQFSRKPDPNIFVFNQEQVRNYSRSFCIQCSENSKDSLPSCSFSRLKQLGFIPGRNVKWNRKFLEFPNFQKKDNLERWTKIFKTNFRKISVPFDFEPEFPEILVEWNAPLLSVVLFSCT